MIFFWKLVMSRIFRKSLGKFGKKLFHQKNQKTLKFYSIWKKIEPNCSENLTQRSRGSEKILGCTKMVKTGPI